ncbi:MAG: hypothetical protein EZS28_016832 [Streblomastix strix]|uniref:PUM-HD domain-containing protein n=1 Tax=Streblomastix strix TaxID=222440 RepID=A0A5J4VYB2_9EUKA|nr:MAG: hypothetical protein EZS28_016832 [Streblomastix strix]
MDKDASRQLQLFVTFSNQQARRQTFEILLKNVEVLTVNQYGNFVIQEFLKRQKDIYEIQESKLFRNLTQPNNQIGKGNSAIDVQIIEKGDQQKIITEVRQNTTQNDQAYLEKLFEREYSERKLEQEEQVGNAILFATKAKGLLIKFSNDQCGCRVMQRLVSELPINEGVKVSQELKPEMSTLLTDKQSSYVIQRLLMLLPPHYLSFILEIVLQPNIKEQLLKTNEGCCVLQHIVNMSVLDICMNEKYSEEGNTNEDEKSEDKDKKRKKKKNQKDSTKKKRKRENEKQGQEKEKDEKLQGGEEVNKIENEKEKESEIEMQIEKENLNEKEQDNKNENASEQDDEEEDEEYEKVSSLTKSQSQVSALSTSQSSNSQQSAQLSGLSSSQSRLSTSTTSSSKSQQQSAQLYTQTKAFVDHWAPETVQQQQVKPQPKQKLLSKKESRYTPSSQTQTQSFSQYRPKVHIVNCLQEFITPPGSNWRELREQIIDQLVGNSSQLANDVNGNYVLQRIINSESFLAHYQKKKYKTVSKVLLNIMQKIVLLSLQKVSSNVIEKCVRYGEKADRTFIFREMMNTKIIVKGQQHGQRQYQNMNSFENVSANSNQNQFNQNRAGIRLSEPLVDLNKYYSAVEPDVISNKGTKFNKPWDKECPYKQYQVFVLKREIWQDLKEEQQNEELDIKQFMKEDKEQLSDKDKPQHEKEYKRYFLTEEQESTIIELITSNFGCFVMHRMMKADTEGLPIDFDDNDSVEVDDKRKVKENTEHHEQADLQQELQPPEKLKCGLICEAIVRAIVKNWRMLYIDPSWQFLPKTLEIIHKGIQSEGLKKRVKELITLSQPQERKPVYPPSIAQLSQDIIQPNQPGQSQIITSTGPLLSTPTTLTQPFSIQQPPH